MDLKKFQEKPRRAIEVCSVKVVTIDYLDHKYKLNLFDGRLVSATGLLEIGELLSDEIMFKLRWDEDAGGMVDVDKWLRGTKKIIKDFIGYHTKQISGAPNRKYSFSIYDESPIFKGVMEVSIKTANRIEKSLRYEIKR